MAFALFVAVISTATIRLTAIKGLVRCSEYPFLRLVPVPLASWWPQSRHHLLGPKQVGDADQVVGHHMQPEHRSHL